MSEPKKKTKAKLELPDKATSGKSMSFAEINAAKQPMTLEVPFVLDPQLKQDLDAAKKVHAAADMMVKAKPDDPERQSRFADTAIELEAALVAAADNAIVFKVKAIPRVEMETMIRDNPATPEQIRRYRKQMTDNGLAMTEPLGYDTDKFPPLVLEACVVEPKLTTEDAQELWSGTSNWSQGEAQILFQACLTVNQTVA